MMNLVAFFSTMAVIYWGAVVLADKSIAEYKRGYNDGISSQQRISDEPKCEDRRKPKMVQRLQQPPRD
jgi:hypothetical protein